jgi:hypothetical protein
MFFIGVDLGQRRDYTAVVVVERKDAKLAYTPPSHFDPLWVRHAERVPLGTPYARVVSGIQQMVRHPEMAGNCAIAVDGTGVGAPIVELLRSARLGCDLSAVTITGGDRQHSYSAMGGTAYSVSKQDLVACVQVMLEREQLKMASNQGENGAGEGVDGCADHAGTQGKMAIRSRRRWPARRHGDRACAGMLAREPQDGWAHAHASPWFDLVGLTL